MSNTIAALDRITDRVLSYNPKAHGPRKLLDLFCCAGGAAAGYKQAGSGRS